MVSKHVYRGINAFLLAYAGYQVPYFVTFNQVKKMVGFVKRSEKGIPVIFWKFLEAKNSNQKTADNQRQLKDGSEPSEERKIPLLRYYTVYNIAQTEGIEDKIPALETPNRSHSPIEKAEQIFSNFPNPPKVVHQKCQAYYDHESNTINIPGPEWFESTEHYYATLFHELMHCTGHHSRLNRRKKGEQRAFGNEKYTKERLIAEMDSAFLMARCGLSKPTLKNSAAYIKNWLQVFENDQTMLVSAAGKAQKAVEWI